MQESKTKEIEISEVPSKVFLNVLHYLYNDQLLPEMQLSTFASSSSSSTLVDMAVEILMVANEYNLSRLVAICEQLLAKLVDEENVVLLFSLAEFHQAEQLKTVCLHYMKWKMGSAKLITNVEFRSQSKETQQQLLDLFEDSSFDEEPTTPQKWETETTSKFELDF